MIFIIIGVIVIVAVVVTVRTNVFSVIQGIISRIRNGKGKKIIKISPQGVVPSKVHSFFSRTWANNENKQRFNVQARRCLHNNNHLEI